MFRKSQNKQGVGSRSSVFRVLLALLVAFSALLLTPVSAQASIVSDNSCRGIDPNLESGLCIQSNSGGSRTWLGNFKSANNTKFFCIDYGYADIANPSNPFSSMKGIKNKNGVSVPDASLRALGYLIQTEAPNAAAGSQTNNAAIALIIREIMNDSNGLYAAHGGGYLRPGDRIGEINGGSGWNTPPSLLSKAQDYWDTASRYYVGSTGKYNVSVSTPNPVTEGVGFTASVHVTGATGPGVPGLPVTLSADRGTVSPTHATTNGSGNVTATGTSDLNVGSIKITAAVSGPTYATYFKPANWPSSHKQRAIVGASIGPAGTGSAQPGVTNTTTTVRALKLDEDTTDPLAGATLRITADGVDLGTWVTGVDGLTPFVSANVGSRVCVYEEVTPSGYVPPPSDVPVICQNMVNSTPVTLTVNNTPTPLLIPTIVTNASSQEVVPNTSIHDSVTVSGTGGETIPATWKLLGPVEPNKSASDPCAGIDYDNAAIADSGSFTVNGDGTQNVGTYTPTVEGCYGYRESLAETATTAAVSSSTSDTNETVLVRRPIVTPTVDTTVDDTGINVEGSTFDNVTVGNTGGETIPAHSELLGPVAADKESPNPCASVDWTGAPVAHNEDWTVDGNGNYEVGQWAVMQEGCYTFVQVLDATWTTNAVTTPPGLPSETLVVRPQPLTPAIVTTVSSPLVDTGNTVTDSVNVTGTGGAEISGTWKLWGPMEADKKSDTPCAKINWAAADVYATGPFSVRGDGTQTVGSTKVTREGCYTYTEALDATWTTDNITTTPGDVSETTLVRDALVTPKITTQASHNVTTTGTAFYDSVKISGIPKGQTIKGTWQTVGPVSPGTGSSPCAKVDWSNAHVVASGKLTLKKDGTVKTGSFTPTKTGCYSFIEKFDATWTTNAFETKAGDSPNEIVHITKTGTTPVPDTGGGGTPSPLAHTGADITRILEIALLMLASGGVLFGASRLARK